MLQRPVVGAHDVLRRVALVHLDERIALGKGGLKAAGQRGKSEAGPDVGEGEKGGKWGGATHLVVVAASMPAPKTFFSARSTISPAAVSFSACIGCVCVGGCGWVRRCVSASGRVM